MQLTNIARDVGEDARAGRLYLPLSWLREVGIDPDAWLARPDFSELLGRVVERLLRAADVLYRRADAGIARLPADCRPATGAARALYAEIGREVERLGFDSVSHRAVVSRYRKVWLISRTLLASQFTDGCEPAPPLAEAGFLIEAVRSAPLGLDGSAPDRIPWWSLVDQLVWVINLFERLERREQEGLSRRLHQRRMSTAV